LGNLLALDGFDYISSEQVRDELSERYKDFDKDWDFWSPAVESYQATKVQWQSIPHLAASHVDSIVRRSAPLSASEDEYCGCASLNQSSADKLGVNDGDSIEISQGDESFRLPVHIVDVIPDACVLIPVAIQGTQNRGAPHAPISIAKHELQSAVNG
jgi:NADH-quinone oxidoreductase subunit G